MTDGKFQIEAFASGEIVPTPGLVDAVQNNTVEMGHTASYYYFGKDPTFAFGSTVPFGLSSRGLNAWFSYGGGNELMNEFYAPTTSTACLAATPARRWAAGAARRSTRSKT